jgi:hypothetical protein
MPVREAESYPGVVDPVTALLSGLGLSGSAGLNAYVPLLVVGLLGRFGVIDLSSPYDSIESTPALVVLGLLFAVEFFADKIPGVDSVNDVVQTVIRPLAGAVLMAGSLGITTHLPTWVGVVAGLLVAGGVHATKAVARPAINVGTVGVGGPIVSTVEDAVAVVTSVLAVLAPLLMVVFVIAVVVVAYRRVSRWRAARAAAAQSTVV